MTTGAEWRRHSLRSSESQGSHDVAQVLGWLVRRSPDRWEQSPVLQMLAVNPGMYLDESDWSYVGFKGGSEQGVLSMAWLLRDIGGNWYVVTGTWNSIGAHPNEDVLLGLLTRSIDLLLYRAESQS